MAGNALLDRKGYPQGQRYEPDRMGRDPAEGQRREREELRQADPDSRFNIYLAGRSYKGMDDPFMHYYDTLDGRQWFQRERQSQDPETLQHLENYMDMRRKLHREQGR
jgi:hypothetical protein